MAKGVRVPLLLLTSLMLVPVSAAAQDDCAHRCLPLGDCDVAEQTLTCGVPADKQASWAELYEYFQNELRKKEREYDEAVAAAEAHDAASDELSKVVATARDALDKAKKAVSNAAAGPGAKDGELKKAEDALADADRKVVEAHSARAASSADSKRLAAEVACLIKKRDLVLDRLERSRNWLQAFTARIAASGAATEANVLGASVAYSRRLSGAGDFSVGPGYSRFELPDGARRNYWGADARFGLKWGDALYTFGVAPQLTTDWNRPAIRGHLSVGFRTGDDRPAPPIVFGTVRAFVEPWISLTGETTSVMFGVELELGVNPNFLDKSPAEGGRR